MPPPVRPHGSFPLPGHAPAAPRRTWHLALVAWLVVALGLLAMAAFERFQADEAEQQMRPLRQLAAVRAELAPGLAPPMGDGGPDRDAAHRAAWLHALERTAVLGQRLADAPLALPNTLSAQARALHAQWAVADLARSPWRGADAVESRAALTAMLHEIDRVESHSVARLAQARAAAQLRHALAWVLLAALLAAGLAIAWHGEQRLRRHAAELRADAERHRELLDLVPQLVWLCDADAHAHYLNRRWARFSGKPLDALLGKGWQDLLHPEDRDATLRDWRVALLDGADRLPAFRLRCADGSYRGFRAQFCPAGEGAGGALRWLGTGTEEDALPTLPAPQQAVAHGRAEPGGACALTTLLSERTETAQRMQTLNEQLQQAEHFARLVADSVPCRLVYWDRGLRCRFVNRTQMEWFGERPADVLGRSLAELRGEAFCERVAARVQAVLGGEAQEFEQTEYNVRGERADTRVQYIPDRRDGEVQGFVVLATNITRDKQAELLLRQRNDELARARDRADAANQAKTVFLANVSHEIRTPLNAILGFAHLLRREIDDPTHQQHLGRVTGAASHLLQVLNDVLDLSRIESGQLRLARVEFSLDALLARASALAADAAREKDIELVVHAEPMPDLLCGDASRLQQALLHLLGNAVKFTERGVIVLRVELLEQAGATLLLRLAVQDTGIGIGAQDLARLFTPFAQADDSSTRRHGGIGLGLALARRIAEQMGGEAGAESRVGSGSSFWFTARLDVAAVQPAARPVPGGLRALVVDGLPQARDALAQLLRLDGLVADTADSGHAALALASRAAEAGTPYDLLLLDADLADMDGVQAGRRLAAVAPARAMVLLAVRDRSALHHLARQAGFGAVLAKPCTAGLVRDTLLRLLAGAGAPDRQAHPRTLLAHTAGARVLLAEDNLVNQEVAVQLLRAAGIAVEVAGDGRAALEMVRARPYDLVLMDVQMPHLDGLEVARRMRSDPALAQVPIVAMTANAFAQDRQACLDAGMNAHLAKPVDPRELHAALLRWLPARLGQGHPPAALPPATPANAEPAVAESAVVEPAVAQPAAPTHAPQEAAAQPDGPPSADAIVGRMAMLIDLPQALEYAAGQPDILLRVLQQFVAHYRGTGTTLERQIGSGDRAGAARTLHGLRGVVGMIGAARVRTMTIALEAALETAPEAAPGPGVQHGPQDADLQAQAAALRAELDALVAAVADRLA